ncbi:DUF5677 domain-containing protein [Enterobacter soli]|uniref:DUF5677 domain-containing protein n=1 Tax=Enterobacter soli TaxID=885040 RepID=UPI003EDB6A1D
MPISKNKRNKSGKSRTTLREHKKKGKILKPAFSQLESKLEGKLFHSNWTYDRLPEMIWAIIIRSAYSQELALQHFKKIISFIKNSPLRDQFKDISITSISELDTELREQLVKVITSDTHVAEALSILRLFPSLPAKETWYKYLPTTTPDINLLMLAVGKTLFHQTQEATDCRWLRIMVLVAANKIHIPIEIIKELLHYPNLGDQRSVRPMIRSLEMTFLVENKAWPTGFWKECWENTPCLALNELKQNSDKNNNDVNSVNLMHDQLIRHWKKTHDTTEIDAKHDCVFGIALYSLKLIRECIEGNVSSGILGRLSLRSLFENYVTLHYLITKNEDVLWKKWRKYGAGQAKLNALRFDENLTPPKYINQEILEIIASEDTWEEYLDIELGNWTNLDLRKLSIESNLKEFYDTYYSWTSGFAHGHWGVIREAEFTTCGNPLHRLHRIPQSIPLQNVSNDLELIFNKILDDLDITYSKFPYRLEL